MEGLKNMSRKFDAVQISVYLDTVYTILKKHRDMSIIQLTFYAFAINKARFLEKSIYTAKVKRNVVEKEISVISGDFEGFSNALPFILKAIHILNKAQIISVERSYIHLQNLDYENVGCNKLSNFENNAIVESKKWSDRRFIKEVLHIV